MNPWFLRSLVGVAMAAGLAACQSTSRQPEIVGGGIEPNQLSPGDTAMISVEIRDRFDIVDRVEGTVEEDPTIGFDLTDDGEGADQTAGDDIWTLQVDVPFNAPPGEFVLDITAYNSDGDPVVVRDESGAAQALSRSYPLAIRFTPAEEEAGQGEGPDANLEAVEPDTDPAPESAPRGEE